MKLKHFIWAFLLLCSIAIYGCGNGAGGGEGLNGSIKVTALASGSIIKATATYSNPQTTNLIGVPLSFSIIIGDKEFPLSGSFNTNNSGSFEVSFLSPPFNGSQTIIVIASSGNLQGVSDPVSMTGRSLAFTPPAQLALTTTADPAVFPTVPFALPASATFIAVTDPFTTNLAGLTFSISETHISGDPTKDTLLLSTATTSTNTGGTAAFPGATGVLAVPTTVGGVNTMTINWTVTDPVTGLTGNGVTTVTLTKTA